MVFEQVLRECGGGKRGANVLEKYINWDEVVIKALRQHEDNRVALTNLREEYAATTDGIGAVDYSKDRVDSSTDGDSSMVNRLLQKETLEGKIKALAQEERMYQRAWDSLTEDEQRILTEFFQRGRRPAQEAVDTLCELYGYERPSIYRKRRQALDRFKRLLVG